MQLATPLCLLALASGYAFPAWHMLPMLYLFTLLMPLINAATNCNAHQPFGRMLALHENHDGSRMQPARTHGPCALAPIFMGSSCNCCAHDPGEELPISGWLASSALPCGVLFYAWIFWLRLHVLGSSAPQEPASMTRDRSPIHQQMICLLLQQL